MYILEQMRPDWALATRDCIVIFSTAAEIFLDQKRQHGKKKDQDPADHR